MDIIFQTNYSTDYTDEIIMVHWYYGKEDMYNYRIEWKYLYVITIYLFFFLKTTKQLSLFVYWNYVLEHETRCKMLVDVVEDLGQMF